MNVEIEIGGNPSPEVRAIIEAVVYQLLDELEPPAAQELTQWQRERASTLADWWSG